MAPGERCSRIQAYDVGFLSGIFSRSRIARFLIFTSLMAQTCHDLHVHVMRSIALGLDLDQNFFDDKINEQCHNMRLLSYPPIKRALLEGGEQARAGSHSGALRFL